jgi:hypothetical protein
MNAALSRPLRLPRHRGVRSFTILPRHQRYLAAAALALTALASTPALAQTYTPTVTTSPNLGIIVPAKDTTTTFTFTSSAGAVTQSGAAVRRTGGTTRGLITIGCSGTGQNCNQPINVKLGSIGTPTGKAGSLSAFGVTSLSGTISASSGTNPISFTIDPVNKDTPASFYFGATFPIKSSLLADGAVGTANSGFYVYVAKSPTVPTAGTSGNATATTYRPIGVTGTPTMVFGTIARPAFQAGGGVNTSTVTMNASTGVVTASGGVAQVSGASSKALYNLTGEGGMAITVTLPNPLTMVLVNQTDGSKTLTVTLTSTLPLPTLLSNAPGAEGTQSFSMGGSFPIDSNTALGLYQGSYDITVAYN